jgi:hypothetical protein
MKILEKINGFYTELKRFNDNVERLTAFNEKKARKLENPLTKMMDTEMLAEDNVYHSEGRIVYI